MTPAIVPATRELLAAIGEKPPGAGRAFAAVLDGEVLGVCGYFHDHARLVLYSKMRPELRRWKKVIVRGVRLAMQAASKVRAPIVATADEAVPQRFLKKLGFEHVVDNVYWKPTWPPRA